MAEKFKVPSKKTIIIAGIIVLLAIIAITGTVVFLKDRGSTEAADLASEEVTRSTTETSTENNQQGSQTQDVQSQGQGETEQIANNQEQNQATEQNSNPETANREETGTTATATATATGTGTTTSGNTRVTATGNAGTTTTTDNIQDTTITRTEEVQIPEKQVSEGHYLGWETMNVNENLSELGSKKMVTEADKVKVEKVAQTLKGTDLVAEGEEITYKIIVTSSKELKNFEVSDKIPEQTTYVTSSASDNGKEVIDGNNVIGIKWNVSFTQNDKDEQDNLYKKEVSFKVTVNKGATGTIVNEDAVANGEKIKESTKTSVITKTKEATIVNGTASNGYVEAGTTIRYTITVTNTGDKAGKATIKDSKPEGTTIVPGTITITTNGEQQEPCSESELAGEIEVDVPAKTDSSAGVVILTFDVTVDEGASKTISNTAYVNGYPTETTETKIKAEIIFNTNGGEPISPITNVGAGEEITNRAMPETTKAGYNLIGWYDNAELTGEPVTELPATYPAGTTIYYAKWEADEHTQYTVEYYYQENGNYKQDPDASIIRYGTTDTQVSIDEKTDKTPNSEITGSKTYVFDESKTDALSGTITGNGELKLQVYFKQRCKVIYHPGNHGAFEEVTKTVDFGENMPVFEGDKTGNTGFYFVKWDTVPAAKVTQDIKYTALWEGLKVTKTRTAINDKDGTENPTSVDQIGDSIEYTITIENIGDIDAQQNIELTDDHNVEVTSITIAGDKVQIPNSSNGETNVVVTAGDNLLKGLNNTAIKKGETIVVTVKYTVETQSEIDAVLQPGENNKIINTAIAKLNNHTYTGKDTTNGIEGTNVTKRVSYVVEYYENGTKNDNYTINNATAPVGSSILYDIPDAAKNAGYKEVKYIGVDGIENGSKEVKEGASNIIKVYLGKPDITIAKTAPATVNAGEDINYTITVTNTGWVKETVTVKDELIGTTYKADSANIAPTSTDTNAQGNQVLIWKDLTIEPADETTTSTTKTITFSAKTDNKEIGTIKENTAKAVKIESNNNETKEIELATSEPIQTKLNEINVNYNEYLEGKEGTALNIILVVDNSSSMNEINSGKYANDSEYVAVAPNDRTKTRLYNAKTAINTFIEQQKNTGNTTTVIKFNDMYGSDQDTIVNLKGQGYGPATDATYHSPFLQQPYYERFVDIDGKRVSFKKYEETLLSSGDIYYEASYNGKNYIIATDGYAYEYEEVKSKQGAQVVTDVENMTIGDLSEGYSTYVNPAFDLVPSYIDNTKTNVVIVLSDGEFRDSDYSTKASNLIKNSGVDYIYSVAFGSDASISKLKEITNVYEKDENGKEVKKVYTATDANSLLNVFGDIEEEAATDYSELRTTVNGVTPIKGASKEIKVTESCPLTATYNTGKPDEKTLFTCKTPEELKNCGITIDGKNIKWDATVYAKENPDEIIPQTIDIKYFVGRD